MNDNGVNVVGVSFCYYFYKKVIIIFIIFCIVMIVFGVIIGSNVYIESIINVILG